MAYRPRIEKIELANNKTGGDINFKGMPAKNRNVIIIAADKTIAQPA